MSRLPAFFALLAVAGGAAVAAGTLLLPPGPKGAEAASATALVRSPVPSLAPQAVPVPDRIRVPPPPATPPEEREREQLRAERVSLEEAIGWRASRPFGPPWAGVLVDGVLLPREGVHFFTWDAVRWSSPSRQDRRWGTDRLVRTLLQVARGYAAAHAGAPRVAIGDLSRPGGGSFDERHGALREFGTGEETRGHVSHQNGLDVDVYYPRRDRLERAPDRLQDVDFALAQDLVDRFVAAGAQFVFVGPRTGLAGPPAIVQPLARHDDHLHVRLPAG